MTTGELMRQVYRQLGKPSYLNPFADDGESLDMGSEGAVDLLALVNRGYKRILNWRFPNGRIVRFRTTERDLFFNGTALTGTATAGAAQTITFDATAAATADRYNGWVIEITDGTGAGQKRLITDYSATRVATVHEAWDTEPDATSEYSVTKNFYDFLSGEHPWVADNIEISPTSEILAVLQVIDLASGSRLVRADRTESFTGVQDSIGSNPSIFADLGGGLIFDTPVPEGRAYRIRYFGMPPALSEAADVPQMPEVFHEAVLLWCVWWGMREMQDFPAAYSTKRDLQDTMDAALQQFDRGNERDDISLYMGGDYGLSS